MNSIQRSFENQRCPITCQKINKIEKKITPYTLFHEIRNGLLSNPVLLEKILYGVDQKLLEGINNHLEENLLQSCSVNFYLLNMLFVGEKRAEQIRKALSLTISETIEVYPEKSCEAIEVLLHHFLSGNEVLRQNREYAIKGDLYKFSIVDIQQSFEYDTEYVRYRNIFKQKVIDLYSGKKITDLHRFSEPVINSLKNELIVNSKTVSNNCSYIYHVAITMPLPLSLLKGTKDEILNAPIGHYHSFILEQYYSEEKEEVYTRLHHSWKNKFTLSEHYNNMGYGDQDEGCYNSFELDAFIENLKGFLMCGNQPEINLGTYQTACFNVPYESVLPVGRFRIKDNIFSGKSIRFMTSKINPAESINHYNQIIQKYS